MMIVDQTSLGVHNDMISCVIATHNYTRVAKYAIGPFYVTWNLKKILWLLLLQDGRVSNLFLFVYYVLFQTEGRWQPHIVMTFYKVRLFKNFEKDNKSEFQRTY